MPTTPTISLIVALANNRAIGKNNQLLWHLPKDFAFFKKHTQNKTIIMGKNTWLSLPVKPLPLRKNIILSCTLYKTEQASTLFSNQINKNKNIKYCKTVDEIPWDKEGENMIIGGASLYQHFLPHCSTLYLTYVNATPEADTFFPKVDLTNWNLTFTEKHPVDEKHQFDFSCNIYKKKE
jgi:dihydrofolate reductase